MQKMIKLFDPFVDDEEEKTLISTLRSHIWASGSGSFQVGEFEKKFKKLTGFSHCIAVNSGTAALHLALSIFDIKDKEVILPSLSFVSTAHAVLMNGAKPIFVEVDPKTLCIDIDSIESSITKNTSIIMPVHFGGYPCKMNEISKLCNKFKINYVDDSAHATGTTFNGEKIGTFNGISCFSFHPVKNLSMPSGGAIAMSDNYNENHVKSLKSKRWCGISNRKGSMYDVNELGWNYYMNEFSAAIGLVQIKKINKIISIKKNIAKQYYEKLEITNKMPFSNDCSYHLYWIRVKNRSKFMKYMQENNVETGIHYKPIHKMKLFHKNQKLPITEKISNEIVSIPIHCNLTDKDVSKIIKLVNNF